jgi:hypothetical protein
MTPYSLALFLHIVGALGMFVALGLEWTSLNFLRRAATGEQAREWLRVFGSTRWLGPAALVLVLLPGFYMMATTWGGVAWLLVALGTVVLIAVLGASLTGTRFGPIGRAAATASGPLAPDLRQRLNDPLLLLSAQTRGSLLLGIVFLMTVKPGLAGSLITIAIALILGVAATLPAWRTAPVSDRSALSGS